MSEQLPAKQIASDIAALLRERPQLWGQGDDPCPRQKCLMEHVANRQGKDSKFFFELRELFYERIKASGSSAVMVAEWNDEPERTVEDVIALCEEVANG